MFARDSALQRSVEEGVQRLNQGTDWPRIIRLAMGDGQWVTGAVEIGLEFYVRDEMTAANFALDPASGQLWAFPLSWPMIAPLCPQKRPPRPHLNHRRSTIYVSTNPKASLKSAQFRLSSGPGPCLHASSQPSFGLSCQLTAYPPPAHASGGSGDRLRLQARTR